MQLSSPVKEILENVGVYLMDMQSKVKTEWKGKDDPVTEADREAQRMLHEQLCKLIPGSDFRGEETAWSTWKGLCWVVDPIDGTKVYIQQRNEWGISVALYDDDTPIFGALYFPATKRYLYATKGMGAYVLGKLSTSETNTVKQARIASSSGKHNGFIQESLPCSTVKLAACAMAEVDAYLNDGTVGTSVWDIAAGRLIIEEAGGTCSDLDGNPIRINVPQPKTPAFLLSNGKMHEQLLHYLKYL